MLGPLFLLVLNNIPDNINSQNLVIPEAFKIIDFTTSIDKETHTDIFLSRKYKNYNLEENIEHASAFPHCLHFLMLTHTHLVAIIL